MCRQHNVRATTRDNTGQNIDRGHRSNPRIEIKIYDPTWNPTWAARLEDRDFTDHATVTDPFYSSPSIIRNLKLRRLRWAGYVAREEESRNAYRVLVERPEVKRPLGRPRRRWEDNIKMDLRKEGCDAVDLINLAQDSNQMAGL